MADQVLPGRAPLGDAGLGQVGPDQPAPGGHVGRRPVDDGHVVAGIEQGGGHLRADEAAASGDEDPHGAPRPARYGPEPMIDVILPVLDERLALPGVLASMPAGYRAIVVDNGSTDGSGPLAVELGAVVVTEPRRGFGAACWAGLTAATSEIVCFMDCDGSLDGADLPGVAGPVVVRAAPTWCSAGAGPTAGHGRSTPGSPTGVLAAEVRRRTGVPLRDLGPMRAARRAALLSLGMQDRRFGWPLEMVIRAAGGGWRIVEVDVAYHPTAGPLQGHRHGEGHGADDPGHGRRPALTPPAVIRPPRRGGRRGGAAARHLAAARLARPRRRA